MSHTKFTSFAQFQQNGGCYIFYLERTIIDMNQILIYQLNLIKTTGFLTKMHLDILSFLCRSWPRYHNPTVHHFHLHSFPGMRDSKMRKWMSTMSCPVTGLSKKISKNLGSCHNTAQWILFFNEG